ncbi:fructosamine kinase family protein [Nanchangia anserum]|uniref:Fructosamine kinase family protein n=1 Tax=Nanchangia anserum TaxID=2692125 RepID=A0A8I0KQC2_9ACTO|nr:fructosamine kinase family protein [Nanchangia anserum]MBD3689825.1 fructosamine kinase family protein [Nanchangia anserum]QOX81995.1 fructosamine kinase family protein [Nanchangia anserum]
MGIQREGEYYTKTNEHHHDQIDLEARGLAWLAEAQEIGGAHVVDMVAHGPGRLRLRAIPSSTCTRDAAHAFGHALARTHAAGAPYYGAPPRGWNGDGWMGNARLTYATSNAPARSWGEFYAHDRLLPILAPARDNGSITAHGCAIVEHLCAKLADGAYDHALPALITAPAARLHGDLWSGNVVWAPSVELTWAPRTAGRDPDRDDSLPTVVGVLIDPAAQGGHAETDLASLGIFGQPYLDAIYDGYNSVSKLADGWRERVGLHQLHMLLVHANLFGGGYGYESVACAKRYA